jgi:serine/threonine protein phosphatase PrpC
MEGWRTNMEDACICIPDIAEGVSLFGVFDGHGGIVLCAS